MRIEVFTVYVVHIQWLLASTLVANKSGQMNILSRCYVVVRRFCYWLSGKKCLLSKTTYYLDVSTAVDHIVSRLFQLKKRLSRRKLKTVT